MLYIRRVAGRSMWPTYRPGQLVIFRRARRFYAGDVVLVFHDDREKIKRISDISRYEVRLTGDNIKVSTDSRHFGAVPLANLKAKVLWPKR